MRSGRHLLIGSSVEILGEGRALLPRLDSPETTVGTGSPGEHRPHESIRVQGPALARLVTALLDLGESHTDVPLTRAIEALATGLDEAQIGVWYEQPATIRLRAEARFADRIDTSRTTSRDRE